MTAASGAVDLITGSGAAVQLEALAVRPLVPLQATSGSTFTLRRHQPANHSTRATTSADRLGSRQVDTERATQATSAPAFSTFQAGDTAVASCLSAPEEWRSLATGLVENRTNAGQVAPPSLVVCGSKQTGKSTCTQLLVNSLLNKYPVVAFLDTDCGQPEFTPPGVHDTLQLDGWLKMAALLINCDAR